MAKTNLLTEDYAGVLLVTFTDSSILDTAVIEQLGRDLYRLAEQDRKHKLVLNFSNVQLLSSHALGVLLTLHKKCKELGGEAVLCGMKPELKKVFTITNLDKVFRFFKDDAAALAAFGVRVQ